jgi:hypothetical protein
VGRDGIQDFLAMLARSVVFLVPAALIVGLVRQVGLPLAPEATGPNTAELIRRAFDGAVRRSYDCLIVGNSRIYRGVNPDRLAMPAFNFAHDADAFNQVYYKLRYLEQHDAVRFRTLVMGVDYFEFSELSAKRNTAYASYLDPEYFHDYAARSQSLTATLLHPVDEDAFNAWMIVNVSRPASLLAGRVFAVVTHDPPPAKERRFLRDNGQYVVDLQVAHDWDLIRRDPARLPIQVRYFRMILSWAKSRGITTVLVMPPVRDIELASYRAGVREEFDEWLFAQSREFGATYFNYSMDEDFTIADFSDITHLTEAGADKFSARLQQDLARVPVRQTVQ